MNYQKLEQAFWKFHHDNAHVYVILCHLARQWMALHGQGKLGVKMLFERARWEIAMTTRDALGFKLNNNHTAFYARLIMRNEADLVGVFNLRQQRVQSSIGPANSTLPSGGHVS